MIDLTLPDEDVKMLIDALSCFEKATGMREDISEVERTSIMGAISSVRKKIEQTKQSIITMNIHYGMDFMIAMAVGLTGYSPGTCLSQ